MPTYEPGLGCPASGCKAGFYTPKERTEHIRANHPDEFAGPTADMKMLADRAGVAAGEVFSDRRAKQADKPNPDMPATISHIGGSKSAQPESRGKVVAGVAPGTFTGYCSPGDHHLSRDYHSEGEAQKALNAHLKRNH